MRVEVSCGGNGQPAGPSPVLLFHRHVLAYKSAKKRSCGPAQAAAAITSSFVAGASSRGKAQAPECRVPAIGNDGNSMPDSSKSNRITITRKCGSVPRCKWRKEYIPKQDDEQIGIDGSQRRPRYGYSNMAFKNQRQQVYPEKRAQYSCHTQAPNR